MGGLYALVAMGHVAVYKVMGIVNLAHGDFAMLGAMTAATLVQRGMGLGLSALLGILVALVTGLLLHRVALLPARQATQQTLMIITLGMSFVIQGSILLILGSQPRALPSFWPGSPFTLGDAALSRHNVAVAVLTLAVMGGTYLLFDRTVLGAALRATMMNPSASRLVGISPELMGMCTFGLSAALAAIAGIAAAPTSLATYNMGLMLGLKGFVVAVIGGLTSFAGAAVAGLVLGTLESLSAGLISSGAKDALAFIFMLVILLLHPQGLVARHDTRV